MSESRRLCIQAVSRLHAFPVVLVFGLAACCSGSNSPVPSAPIVKASASFIDRTSGLGVLSAGGASFTVADGLFEFPSGQSTTFFIGNSDRRLEIGTATLPQGSTAATLVTPRQFQSSSATASENITINVLRLLQTLDVDLDFRNGVTIDGTTRSQVSAALSATVAPDFSTGPAQFATLAPIAAALTAVGRPLLTPEVAMANFLLKFPQSQSQSSSVALTSDHRRLLVANRQNASVSLIEVRNAAGADTQTLLGEVAVGPEPRFVAIAPDNRRAYVTNAEDGTLHVIDISGSQPVLVGNPVAVGLEPRGIAPSPTGRIGVVANSTLGSVALVDVTTSQVSILVVLAT